MKTNKIKQCAVNVSQLVLNPDLPFYQYAVPGSQYGGAATSAQASASERGPYARKVVRQQSPSFRLLDLSQDLIDLTYIEMIRAGSTNILQTPRIVYARASHFVKCNGIYRINIKNHHIPRDHGAYPSFENHTH